MDDPIRRLVDGGGEVWAVRIDHTDLARRQPQLPDAFGTSIQR